MDVLWGHGRFHVSAAASSGVSVHTEPTFPSLSYANNEAYVVWVPELTLSNAGHLY